VTSEHPFFVAGKGWVEVRRLERGDRIVSEREATLAVADVSLEERSTLVYNFEVAQDHNYFVGDAGAEAHNARVRPPGHVLDEIFDKLGGICPKCQRPMRRRVPPTGPRADVISCDHRVPQSRGGGDDPRNLDWMCLSCNAKKGAR
jgi:hypothetical protein